MQTEISSQEGRRPESRADGANHRSEAGLRTAPADVRLSGDGRRKGQDPGLT